MVSCSSKTNDAALRVIVLFGKKIRDGFRYHCAEPFHIVELHGASERAPLPRTAMTEKTGNLDRSTRRFTDSRAGGDSTMVMGYYNNT
jgi:hypothetical protein